jgi:VWFA-related protein
MLSSILVGVTLAAAAPQALQPPFKTGVELVMVDAQVVDKKGDPVPGLAAGQFQVTIDGKKRQVVSADFISAATGLTPAGTAPAAGAAPGTPAPSAGNIYVLAVDQGSFRPVNAPSVTHAVREFLKRVNPTDYVGIISFPSPGVRLDPTRDRKLLDDAVSKLVGFSQLKGSRRFQFSLSDAIDVVARDADALGRVVQRNCPPNDLTCGRSVEIEMNDVVSVLELQAARSLHGLREVVGTLKALEGRKTMVVLSAGIPTGDRSGGRLYMRSDAMQLGKDAQMAGILLYTLHLNTAFLDAFSPDAPSAQQTVMRETAVYARGLDMFNGYAGGTFFEVNTGANFAIDRLVREMSAHYLLGVQVEEADRDGRPHLIQVKANQKDTSVRNRASVVISKRGS